MKKPRLYRARSDPFESLHDDIIITILCKLSSTANSPSDFISVLLTCKRLNILGLHPLVLSKSCSKTLAVRGKRWCNEAHRFLILCVNSGNSEAYYMLGMIRFYCLQNRGSGASFLAKASIRSHALALYSLALIQFNGSGGLKNEQDLRAGVALCARSAFLGHVDALRELGHCFQDGYGVRKNVNEGRRYLVQANARELALALRVLRVPVNLVEKSSVSDVCHVSHVSHMFSDYGFDVTRREKEIHPVNKFMIEWFGTPDHLGPGLRMCSYKGCGRPETRKNEFRRCSGCGKVNYCSRGCQAHDWMVQHKVECAPMEEWLGHAIGDVEEGGRMNGEDVVMDLVNDQTVEVEGR